jgi:hypothetical protein
LLGEVGVFFDAFEKTKASGGRRGVSSGWPMIPLIHYIVRLLHILIGIGNNIYDNFRDIVNEKIECLDEKEAETRSKAMECEDANECETIARNDWNKSEKGTMLRSLQSRIRTRRNTLKRLGVASTPTQSSTKRKRTDVDINELYYWPISVNTFKLIIMILIRRI